MYKQAAIQPERQKLVVEWAKFLYPEAAEQFEIPGIVILTTGMKAYNRNGGYIASNENLIVGFQCLGRNETKELIDVFIVHELAHWYQFHVAEGGKERRSTTTNTHTLKSWQVACMVGAKRLYPEFDWTPDLFSPAKSIRDKESGKILKQQREGALTKPELHHYPEGLIEWSDRLGIDIGELKGPG